MSNLWEIEIFASDAPVDVQYVLTRRLKVCRRVIRLCDEKLQPKHNQNRLYYNTSHLSGVGYSWQEPPQVESKSSRLAWLTFDWLPSSTGSSLSYTETNLKHRVMSSHADSKHRIIIAHVVMSSMLTCTSNKFTYMYIILHTCTSHTFILDAATV